MYPFVSIAFASVKFPRCFRCYAKRAAASTHRLGIDLASKSIAPDFDPAMLCGAERLQANFPNI